MNGPIQKGRGGGVFVGGGVGGGVVVGGGAGSSVTVSFVGAGGCFFVLVLVGAGAAAPPAFDVVTGGFAGGLGRGLVTAVVVAVAVDASAAVGIAATALASPVGVAGFLPSSASGIATLGSPVGTAAVSDWLATGATALGPLVAKAELVSPVVGAGECSASTDSTSAAPLVARPRPKK